MSDRRTFVRFALVGASAANLALMLVWDALFQCGTANAFFLECAPVDAIAAVLNVVLAALLTGGIAVLVARDGRRMLRVMGGVLALLAAVVVANVVRQELRLTPNDAGRWIGALSPGGVRLAVMMACAGSAVVLLWRTRWVAVTLTFLALVTSPFLLVTIGRALATLTTGRLREQFVDRPRAPWLAQTDGARPRVVLVVFDELDYRLAFGARPSGVRLPAFDALASEALVATDARSPASNTNEAMPALLTGRGVVRLEGLGAREGRLDLLPAGTHVSTDSVSTFLSAAHALGANVALVGWNLPYCRTALGDGTVACDWWPSGILPGRPASLVATMAWQWVAASPVNARAVHRWRHEAMLALALQHVANPRLDLVVLHLVPPHYPWIYDARRDGFTLTSFGPSGYLGNLVLADRSLRSIQHAIESSGLAGRTTLVVTSDHPWRESRSLDGRRDERVPFMMRLAGAAAPDTLREAFNTIWAGPLIHALLADSLGDPLALHRWLRAHASARDGPTPP